MDQIFNPAQRKWISPPVHLVRCMEEMKRLVRLHKDSLVFIDPVLSLEAGSSGGPRNPSGPGGGEEEDYSVGAEYVPEYLRADAMKYEEESVTEPGSGLREGDVEGQNEGKWSESDAACEAAVAAVGGNDFFTFGKKPKQEDGKPKQRGRKAKAAVEDDEDAADQNSEKAGPSVSIADVKTEVEDKDEEEDDDDDDDDDEEECPIKLNDWDDDEIVCETGVSVPGWNEFAGLGKKRTPEERRRQAHGEGAAPEAMVQDVEGNPNAEATVNDEEEKVEESGPSCSNAGRSKKTESGSTPNIDDIKQEDAGESQKKETTKDAVADFKRFSEWVFSQNGKRDLENKQKVRPALMEKFDISERQVKNFQEATSAHLTSVRGEVFQDDPVMQSSSMPQLAPPTNIRARTTLQSLAIFLTHGEDPSVFPWKSINVQQQMNDDFVNHQFLTRMEQQKRDIINPAMKNQLVNKQDDFLVQILIYQNTDPDDVLTDEVKLLRGGFGGESIAAWNIGKRKAGRQAGEVGDTNDEFGPTSVAHRYIEPKLAYELHMLGSQTVKDLMNSFHCESDYVCLKDVPHPDNYKEDPTSYAKAHFPGSMILIHDVVYCDPKSDVDYVSIINEWAAKPPEKHIGPFRRGDWNTKLKDLTLSFGFPYVYIHLGGCEHVYVFTKSRLLHVEDDHLLKSYPKIVGMSRFKNVYCRVDNEYLARWAVLDFKEFPENPMLLCTDCVQMYCYDKNKKKRGDFKLYPFTQLANIL